MLSQLNQYFENQPPELKDTFMAMRHFVLQKEFELTEHYKYRTAFYYYKGKPFCYFHAKANTGIPYIGIARGHLVEHPLLYQGDRKKMKVIRIPTNEDIPVQEISALFKELRALY
jgi:uncharacterized protein YdhG (YjbR/CyaY superfamily)